MGFRDRNLAIKSHLKFQVILNIDKNPVLSRLKVGKGDQIVIISLHVIDAVVFPFITRAIHINISTLDLFLADARLQMTVMDLLLSLSLSQEKSCIWISAAHKITLPGQLNRNTEQP